MSDAPNRFAWVPDEEIKQNSLLQRYIEHVGAGDYDGLLAWCDADPARFWNDVIEFLDIRFATPYEQVVDLSDGPEWAKWCVGGTTNVALNCLDKHRGMPVMAQTFCIWQGEDGRQRTWTYADLDREASRLAAALQDLGLGPGDPIAVYLPMLPETAAAHFAIARMGGLVVPLFSGFGPDAIATRLNDCDAKLCLTVDATRRRGNIVAMKAVLDEALTQVPSIEHVIVLQDQGLDVAMTEGRDHDWAELTEGQVDDMDSVMVPADDGAILVYTSGTTGKPKGAISTHCAVAVKTAIDLPMCLDLKPSDRILWMTDYGWAVGPIVITATAYNGGSMIMAEGAPDYPEPGRIWRLIQDLGVTALGVAPTLVRGLMRYGTEEPAKFDLSSLRLALSTGEPWTDEAWWWLFDHILKRKAPILNWCGGTEITGGIISSNVLTPMTPCSFAGPMPGMAADIVDDAGQPVAIGQVGELVMRQPSIGLTRGLWRDPERYLEAYWSMYEGLWRQGDWAYRDEDGLWYVTGRSDDTLNISGKRTGPAEIEGLVMASDKIIEAAAIGIPDPISGTAVMCVCVPAPGVAADEALKEAVENAVVEGMGKSFRPKHVLFVEDLPKTRTLKIMRRVIRALVLDEAPGDLSSLVNPEAVEAVKREAAKRD